MLVACGSSYHAALVGKLRDRGWARLGCDVDIASEFRYRGPVLDERTLVVGVSQSGETIDTLQALREARERGAQDRSRSATSSTPRWRGRPTPCSTRAPASRSASPSTKTVLAQIAALELLALRLAQVRGDDGRPELDEAFDGLLARSPSSSPRC